MIIPPGWVRSLACRCSSIDATVFEESIYMVMGKVLFYYIDGLCSSSLLLPYSCIYILGYTPFSILHSAG